MGDLWKNLRKEQLVHHLIFIEWKFGKNPRRGSSLLIPGSQSKGV